MATEVGRSYVTMVTKGYSTGEWGGCNPKKPNATANFKYGTGFFWVAPPPPSVDGEQLVEGMLWGRRAGLNNEERKRPRGNVLKLHITKLKSVQNS